MAVRGRRQVANGLDAWPGYVDALSTLLMVVIFVLLVFVLSQSFLAAALTGRDQALEELRRELSAHRGELAQERQRVANLVAGTGDLERQVAQGETARRSLSHQVQDLRDLTSQLTADRDRLVRQATDSGLALDAAAAAAERLRQSLGQTAERAETVARERDVARMRATEAERQVAELDRSLRVDRATIEAKLSEVAELARQAQALVVLRDTLARQIRELDGRLAAETRRREEAEASAADRTKALMAERDVLVRQTKELDGRLAAEARRREGAEASAADRAGALSAAREEFARQAQAQSAERDVLAWQIKELDGRLAAEVRRREEAEASAADRTKALTALREDLARQVQALGVDRDALARQINELEGRLAAEARRREGAEASATDRASALTMARAELAALRRDIEAQRREAELHRQQAEIRRDEIARVAAALELAQSNARARDTTITQLEQRLNVALADRVRQLERYRSDFFGRLRDLLESRVGIQVVGDRFIFQSEVLFPVGSSDMTQAGRAQMTTLASTIRQIAAEIPSDVPWVLRVDGHTDRSPVRGSTNWELAAARAITVVKFLVSQDVPPERLAATAFGEFQPLGDDNSPEAMARNRRIEMRLTDR